MHKDLPATTKDFLERFKAILTYHPDQCGWIDRQEMLAGLEALGITRAQAEDFIREQLDESHHHRGPEEEHDQPEGCVTIFHCHLHGAPNAYVKLGLRLLGSRSGQLRAVIWSFKPL